MTTRRLPVLQRRGDCNRCGDCCVGDPYTGAGEGDCPHLRRDARGHTSCEIHGQTGTYWARGCNVWPTKPEHLAQPHMTRCSFTFEAS